MVKENDFRGTPTPSKNVVTTTNHSAIGSVFSKGGPGEGGFGTPPKNIK